MHYVFNAFGKPLYTFYQTINVRHSLNGSQAWKIFSMSSQFTTVILFIRDTNIAYYYEKQGQIPGNFHVGGCAALRNLQIFILEDSQRCESLKFSFWEMRSAAKPSNFHFGKFSALRNLQIFILGDAQRCETFKFSFWKMRGAAKPSNFHFGRSAALRKPEIFILGEAQR
ncbi:MAG: hypothetical protein LBU37_00265 [Tannerellaceae bacterium]|jgi:hypothetical protein|nr:hypothetical protein [Tannerellaceae bacterium]